MLRYNTMKFKKAVLKDGDSRFAYLDVFYEYTDDTDNKHELEFHNIHITFTNHPLAGGDNGLFLPALSIPPHVIRKVNVGFGDTHIDSDFQLMDKITEYAIKEMTLEEIEQKLGHKVKIVGDHNENKSM